MTSLALSTDSDTQPLTQGLAVLAVLGTAAALQRFEAGEGIANEKIDGERREYLADRTLLDRLRHELAADPLTAMASMLADRWLAAGALVVEIHAVGVAGDSLGFRLCGMPLAQIVADAQTLCGLVPGFAEAASALTSLEGSWS